MLSASLIVHCTSVCDRGDVRLSEGTNNLEGRVEICYKNQWGTVCSDGFGASEISVVCRQLGFSDTGQLYTCIGCARQCLVMYDYHSSD